MTSLLQGDRIAGRGLTDSPIGIDCIAASQRPLGGFGDREHLLERLHNLRKILPVFATELANARRQAAQLRVENKRLLEKVRRLQGADEERRYTGTGRAA